MYARKYKLSHHIKIQRFYIIYFFGSYIKLCIVQYWTHLTSSVPGQHLLIFRNFEPRNFQTNNTRKLPLVQMNDLFKSFPMMYQKCQKSSISKSIKTLNKKKWTEHKVPPQNSFGLEQKKSICGPDARHKLSVIWS